MADFVIDALDSRASRLPGVAPTAENMTDSGMPS